MVGIRDIKIGMSLLLNRKSLTNKTGTYKQNACIIVYSEEKRCLVICRIEAYHHL